MLLFWWQKTFPAKKGDRNIDTVIDSGITDHCFADVNVFTKYKKFEILLVRRIAEKGTNFSIAGQETVRMTIKVEDGKKMNLIFQDILYTSELCSNLISILKICNMSLNVVFSINDVVARLDNRHTAI